MTADTLAGRLRELAGSKPGVAQAGFVTVSASELERIATDLETLPMLGAWLPTREQLRAMAEQLRDENDFGLRYKPLVADWLDAFATALEAMPSREEAPEAVKAALVYHIANDLERSIAALGYPVGCGVGPHPDVCAQAATRIVDKIADAALEVLACRRDAAPPPPQGGA